MDKEIVDNQKDKYTMSMFINEVLEEELSKKNSTGELDISTGFFNLSGYRLISDLLKKYSKEPRFSLRLLFGKEAMGDEQHSTFEDKIKEYSMTKELDLEDLQEESAMIVDDLINFIEHKQVYVKRNNTRFNHSKCYIFPSYAAVGSSNLTGAGLAGNVELNAILYQPSARKELKEWFERRWDEADEAKDELLSILQESKFGRPIEPHKMYMKILYEYYRARLEELEKGTRKDTVELTDFQRDAVVSAVKIIEKYGGVIIGDSTGLGKTHIGLSLLRDFASVKRKKVLLIAPQQVLKAVWEPRLFEESIKTINESIEKTGAPNFDPTDYVSNIDIVLIDESHNYRTSSTNRYNNLLKILSGGKRKLVILLTATPVNNSLMDLSNQISLITCGDDAHFAELGIPDLRNYFLNVDKKLLSEGIDDIVKLLDEIMIRRTRNFIKESYPDSTLNDQKINFPERKLRKVEYSLTNVFGSILYEQVIQVIDNLFLVPYRVPSYRITVEEKEKEVVEHRASLQKYGLLKRFESSVEAIRKSISRLSLFYQTFDELLKNGKLINSQKFQEFLIDFLDEEEETDEEEFFKRIQDLYRDSNELESAKYYDTKRMKRELDEDIKRLSPLKLSLESIQEYSDTKLAELKILFAKDKVFETGGKKVVIFTQYVDTAKYIYNNLVESIKDKKILLLTGKTDQKTRKKYLMEFAPLSNNPTAKTIEKEADILVTSDVLSEGQNLQDANYAINYDLPWNPMKIVQRVGRVDRLTSKHPVVTSAVFFPEKELEDELGLLVKLKIKIDKASGTVGIESTILGEKENPKNFNAFDRIKKQDASLLDDMERSMELLPSVTPYQEILRYLKKIGQTELKGVPFGKRSGKSSVNNGLVLCYTEKGKRESLHFIHFDYKIKKFDHINDVSWIFKKLRCDEDTQLNMPLNGFDVFRQIHLIDNKAREEILLTLNAPFELRRTRGIKLRYQNELLSTIFDAYKNGKIPSSDVLPIYNTLKRSNYYAWEKEFKEIYEIYQKDQNIQYLLISISVLLKRYKIEQRELIKMKKKNKEDLLLIGCMFLVNSIEDWNLLTI
jgi:superfamily II DNA or RNA helicase